MIEIICAKHKKNPSTTLDTTERTRFSKSRLNDLEDIGQGQRSSHATHPLMLLIICTKYGKNPSWNVDATGRTWKVNGRTDGQGESNIPPQLRCRGNKNQALFKTAFKFKHFSRSVGTMHVIVNTSEKNDCIIVNGHCAIHVLKMNNTKLDIWHLLLTNIQR